MNYSVLYSALLHLSLFMVAYIGLPSLFSSDIEEERMITVELLPVSAVDNVKPKQRPEPETPKEQPEPEPKIEKKPKIFKKVEPVPEPPKAIKKPKKVVLSTTKPTKKPAIKKQQETQPPVRPKPKPKEKPVAFDTKSLLKTLEKAAEEAPKKPSLDIASLEKSLTANNAKTYDASQSLSISERTLIKQRITEHWSIDVGKYQAGEMVVELDIFLNQNGSVREVKILDLGRYEKDPKFKVAVDEAIRAIYSAFPIAELTKERYHAWKESRYVFDPSEMIGY